ncbi:hypothetical protein CDV36_003572 [Fusarium kuroshium]|uniref:Prion-inhibition and propagation HeLo domain-containing protein n=1 Tax=Fusarium kuroshium TaxID=2010991 RepID=A0A3M2SGV2_9HYPO|nr:hypothetical protein CDV36_003572 [Fusarium kuroshium]
MAFEPISGTIGAVAFADQMFARCVWVYKKYKLSQDFGSDYVEYQTKYHCEIFRFDQIISHPHSGLAESALDTGQRHLREPLRSRLQIWMADLNKCGKLVAKYEEKLEPNSDGAEDDTVEEASTQTTPTTRVPSPPVSPTTHPAAISAIMLSTRAAVAPGMPLLPVGSRDYRRHSEPAQPPITPTEQNTPNANKQQPVREQGFPVDVPHTPFDTAAAREEVAGRAAKVQDRTKLKQLVGWVAESRSDIITLLDKLEKHAQFFDSVIQLDQSKQTILRYQREDELRTKVDNCRDIGDRLRMLLQSWRGLTGSNQAAFQLMLHNDPVFMQSRFRQDLGLSSLQLGGAAFYARLLPSTEHFEDGGAPARYLLFGVHQTSAQPSPTLGATVTTELSSIGQFLDNAAVETAEEPSRVRELGNIKLLSPTNGLISVFSDSTIHGDEKTLAASLIDESEKKFFQEPSQALFRTQLALVLAYSLIYVQRADGLKDLDAKELRYYATSPDNGQTADLTDSRINPFAPLRMVGLPTTMGSSHAILTCAARGDNDETMSMIRSLGILLYEIGSWSISEGNTIREKVNFVKSNKAAVAGTMPWNYHDAIDLCLRARNEAMGNLEDWLVRNVVGPLEQARKNIEGLQLIT